MSSRHRQFLEYHPAIGHLYVPGLRVRMMHENHGYWLTTNNQGFRSDTDYVVPKRAGVRRIAIVGDSFTAGDGVANRDRFSDVIARRLPGVEVLNFGLTHSGTDQQYLIYRDIVAPFEPDVVVVCPMVENIRRNMRVALPNRTHDGRMFERSKPYFTLENGTLVPHNIPVPRPRLADEKRPAPGEGGAEASRRSSLSRLKTGLRTAAVAARVLPRIDFVPEYADANGPAWQLMRAILERWIAECPVPVVIAPVPWFLHYVKPDTYDNQTYRRRFAELTRERVRVCDPLPAMLAHPLSEREAFTYEHDKHFTARGHQVFGEALAGTLAEVLQS